MRNFSLYSQYYDLLYKTKDYKAESEYIKSLLMQYGIDVMNILELGSGSGAHAEYLCKADFNITGIERSAEMIDISMSKKIKNFSAFEGDISKMNLDRKFDAVISLFHVISYITDNDSLINCFKLTSNHLKKGGLFLFDVWYSPAVYIQKPETRIKRFENAELKITRIAESESNYNENVVSVNYEISIYSKVSKTISIVNEIHPMRHFSLPEVKLLATLTGFDFIQAEEFLTRKKPDLTTWGICILLRKR